MSSSLKNIRLTEIRSPNNEATWRSGCSLPTFLVDAAKQSISVSAAKCTWERVSVYIFGLWRASPSSSSMYIFLCRYSEHLAYLTCLHTPVLHAVCVWGMSKVHCAHGDQVTCFLPLPSRRTISRSVAFQHANWARWMFLSADAKD